MLQEVILVLYGIPGDVFVYSSTASTFQVADDIDCISIAEKGLLNRLAAIGYTFSQLTNWCDSISAHIGATLPEHEAPLSVPTSVAESQYVRVLSCAIDNVILDEYREHLVHLEESASTSVSSLLTSLSDVCTRRNPRAVRRGCLVEVDPALAVTHMHKIKEVTEEWRRC